MFLQIHGSEDLRKGRKLFIDHSITFLIMSLIDYIRGEFVSGKVVDKYRLDTGNLGILVQQKGTYKRYHVEFEGAHDKPSIYNLYGLLSNPFNRKSESVSRLIGKDDNIELTLSYSHSPLRKAYRLHSTVGPKNYTRLKTLPYKPARISQY